METANINIYDYSSARQFLLDSLAEKQRLRPGFSLRQWSIRMGMPSHTLLTLLLQGKRPIRLKHLKALNQGLTLNSQQQLYLQALVQLEGSTTPEEKNLCRVWLADLHPGGEFRTKELDEFSLVACWIHMTILSMTRLKSFRGTPGEIRRRLGGKISVHEIRAALSRLRDLGLVTEDATTGKLLATHHRVVSKNDIASSGAREYHRQVMDLAKHSLEEQTPSEREFQAFALAIPSEKLPLAKEMLRKFRQQFAKAVGAEVGEGDHVYQTNFQFFRLTESPELSTAVAGDGSEDEGAESPTPLTSTSPETLHV